MVLYLSAAETCATRDDQYFWLSSPQRYEGFRNLPKKRLFSCGWYKFGLFFLHVCPEDLYPIVKFSATTLSYLSVLQKAMNTPYKNIAKSAMHVSWVKTVINQQINSFFQIGILDKT